MSGVIKHLSLKKRLCENSVRPEFVGFDGTGQLLDYVYAGFPGRRTYIIEADCLYVIPFEDAKERCGHAACSALNECVYCQWLGTLVQVYCVAASLCWNARLDDLSSFC